MKKSISKRLKSLRNLLFRKSYTLSEAIELLKKTASTQFIETAEAHFCLQLNAKVNSQQLRINSVLPNGTGKAVKIAVLVSEEADQNILISQGADIVGSSDLIDEIEKGNLNFDVLLTTPDQMPNLTKFGKILGSKGLMPSLKSGTISTDISSALNEFKAGKVECRADKTGVVHVSFGKVDFSTSDLIENFMSVYTTIKQNRPSGVKGKFFKKITICTTMGPAIDINISTLP